MSERIQVEYVDQPPMVQEVGGKRVWQARALDQFDNVWYEMTEGYSHTRAWIKSSEDGRMIPKDSPED